MTQIWTQLDRLISGRALSTAHHKFMTISLVLNRPWRCSSSLKYQKYSSVAAPSHGRLFLRDMVTNLWFAVLRACHKITWPSCIPSSRHLPTRADLILLCSLLNRKILVLALLVAACFAPLIEANKSDVNLDAIRPTYFVTGP